MNFTAVGSNSGVTSPTLPAPSGANQSLAPAIPIPGGTLPGYGNFNAVTCTAISQCLAVGGTDSGTAVAAITSNAGSTWASQSVPQGTTTLDAVSCGGPTNCVAVGQGDIMSTSETATPGQNKHLRPKTPRCWGFPVRRPPNVSQPGSPQYRVVPIRETSMYRPTAGLRGPRHRCLRGLRRWVAWPARRQRSASPSAGRSWSPVTAETPGRRERSRWACRVHCARSPAPAPLTVSR